MTSVGTENNCTIVNTMPVHRTLMLTSTLSSFSALRYLSLGGGAVGGQQPEVSREDGRTKQTSPANVYEVAKPILQGCHAVPTKLKILLDRALSVLCQEEVVMIITSCGWHLEDYQRGYKLKVSRVTTL